MAEIPNTKSCRGRAMRGRGTEYACMHLNKRLAQMNPQKDITCRNDADDNKIQLTERWWWPAGSRQRRTLCSCNLSHRVAVTRQRRAELALRPYLSNDPDSHLLLGVLLLIMFSCLKKHGSKRVMAASWDCARMAKRAKCARFLDDMGTL